MYGCNIATGLEREYAASVPNSLKDPAKSIRIRFLRLTKINCGPENGPGPCCYKSQIIRHMKLRKNVAVSEAGLLFNPVNGESYSLNPIGVDILNLIREIE